MEMFLPRAPNSIIEVCFPDEARDLVQVHIFLSPAILVIIIIIIKTRIYNNEEMLPPP